MKIFTDHHHGGLGRSLFLLFHERLGHDLYVPGASFAQWANSFGHNGLWLPIVPDHYATLQGVPERYWYNLPFIVDREQFLSQDWDVVIVSRPESVPLIKELLAQHQRGRSIKVIGQAGNEKTEMDWGFVRNFMSSDLSSFARCPVHKIHYSQELGQQYHRDVFEPIKPEHLKTVVTFTNCLNSFQNWRWDRDRGHWNDRCPHCDSDQAPPTSDISVFGLWNNLKSAMPQCQFKDYGINNTYGMLAERDMPRAYLDSACGYYFKTYEGYGHSLLQSVALGRIPIIPKKFFQYRTARQYLMPYRTCLECDWNIDSLVAAIRYFTDNIHRANEMSFACWQTAKGLFNWEYEASRVKRFLEELV